MDNFEKLKILAVADKVLSEPGSEKEADVPGTHFTKEGVARLMTELKERAGNPNAQGNKISERALAFLTNKETGDEDVHGASLAQLKRLSTWAAAARARLNVTK